MKILKQGNTNPSWVGKRAECIQCGCIFLLERGDHVSSPDPREPNYVYIDCPTCHRTVGIGI